MTESTSLDTEVHLNTEVHLAGDELRRRVFQYERESFGPRRIVTLLLLVAAWCGLWGSFSAANLVTGFVVGVVVIMAKVGGSSVGGIRLIPLMKLAGLVSIDTVTSTWSVIREVLTPTDYTEEGIIAVDLPDGSVDHLFLLFVAITITPGTAVVAAEHDGSVMYLHVLHRDRRSQIEEHVGKIARLAIDALSNGSTARSTIKQMS